MKVHYKKESILRFIDTEELSLQQLSNMQDFDLLLPGSIEAFSNWCSGYQAGYMTAMLWFQSINREWNVMEAVDGKITYTDNFNVDWERLVCAFMCTLVELHVHTIHDIEEIINHERLTNLANKYGLFDVTNATFERQGFRLNEKYYLYNIFIDTSICGASKRAPKTIQIILDIQPSVKILMRCDKNLAVPYSQKVSTASWDFQKWRGITLDFSNIAQQFTGGKGVPFRS